jgi:hypothetical protein
MTNDPGHVGVTNVFHSLKVRFKEKDREKYTNCTLPKEGEKKGR